MTKVGDRIGIPIFNNRLYYFDEIQIDLVGKQHNNNRVDENREMI